MENSLVSLSQFYILKTWFYDPPLHFLPEKKHIKINVSYLVVPQGVDRLLVAEAGVDADGGHQFKDVLLGQRAARRQAWGRRHVHTKQGMG